jgi:hypothetical protein
MGTSSSSNGSPSDRPIVPPWTPPPLAPADGDGENGDDGTDDGQTAQPATPTSPTPALALPVTTPALPLAPPGRFQPARLNLGRFASTGSRDNMRRAVGHDIHKGLQGSRNAVQRFGGTTRAAGSLYGALSTLASGAMQRALAAMLEQFPDADLLDLTEEQRLFATECYLALDVFNRACLDLGKTLFRTAPSVASALSRMAEIRNYIRETISAQFRRLRSGGVALTARKVSELARDALREAFLVFEVDAT